MRRASPGHFQHHHSNPGQELRPGAPWSIIISSFHHFIISSYSNMQCGSMYINVVCEYCDNTGKRPHLATLGELLNLVHRYKWNHTIEPCHSLPCRLPRCEILKSKQIVTASQLDRPFLLTLSVHLFRDNEWSTSRPFLMDTDDRGTCTGDFTNGLRESLLHHGKNMMVHHGAPCFTMVHQSQAFGSSMLDADGCWCLLNDDPSQPLGL